MQAIVTMFNILREHEIFVWFTDIHPGWQIVSLVLALLCVGLVYRAGRDILDWCYRLTLEWCRLLQTSFNTRWTLIVVSRLANTNWWKSRRQWLGSIIDPNTYTELKNSKHREKELEQKVNLLTNEKSYYIFEVKRLRIFEDAIHQMGFDTIEHLDIEEATKLENVILKAHQQHKDYIYNNEPSQSKWIDQHITGIHILLAADEGKKRAAESMLHLTQMQKLLKKYELNK